MQDDCHVMCQNSLCSVGVLRLWPWQCSSHSTGQVYCWAGHSSHSTGQLYCCSGHSSHSTGHHRYHPDHLSSEKRKKKHISGLCTCVPPHQTDSSNKHCTPLFVQALRNLVNRSGQIAVQIFNDLDRRLKSADKKDQPGLRAESRGQGREGEQKMDNRKRRSGNQTPSTTTSTVK